MLPLEKLRFFANYIEQELGIVYSETNYFQLQNRIKEMAGMLSLGSEDAVYEEAKKGIQGHLKQLLLDIATNNETSFFRDPKAFEGIQKAVIQKWIDEKKADVRVWSAASSFGQEPYTLSMLMTEANAVKPAFRWEILATDVADIALKRSKEGKYSQLEVQRGLSAGRLVKYFEKTPDNAWVVKPELKSKIRFQKQNLLDSFDSLGKFDLVLCRNVLIYQKVEGKKKVVSKIAKLLNPGGFLIMGAGESLLGLTEAFQMVNVGGAVFYQLKAENNADKKAA